jgi:hypothetical protein
MASLTVLEGDEIPELLGASRFSGPRFHRRGERQNPDMLGFSLIHAAGHAFATAGRTVAKGTGIAAKATGHAAGITGRAVGHAVATAARVTDRVIKRIVRAAARKLLLHGDYLGTDSVTSMSKGAAVTAVTAAGTAAVAAAFTPATAAGAAPIIAIAAKDSVDEIYSSVQKKIAGGKPPAQAADQASKEFKDDPPIPTGVILAGAGLLAFLFLRNRST